MESGKEIELVGAAWAGGGERGEAGSVGREAEGGGLTTVEAEGAGRAGVSLNPNAVQGTDQPALA